MRILSQDGMIDVAYDLGNLSIGVGRFDDVERASIFFHSCSCNATKLAEYKSEEKARKAMEILHTTYRGNKIEETYHEGTNYYHPIFQFPADDEVEG